MILKTQRGRGKKIHILLDDEYVITTDIDYWAEIFIADGTDISDEDWLELSNKINYRKAFNKCADLLSRRNHSVKELRTKLLKSADIASVDKVIDKFTEMGYLDDEKFAYDYAEYLLKYKNFSENHIKQELFYKGIDREIISNVLEDLEVNNEEAIIKIINKSYLNKLKAEGGKDKVIAALMRKGFSYRDIKSALNEIENE